MKTADFIKAVKNLGLSAYEECNTMVMIDDDSDTALVMIDTGRMCVLGTNFTGFMDLDETVRKKLFALVAEYSFTPIDEREKQ